MPIPCRCGQQPIVGYLGHAIRIREPVAIQIRCKSCGLAFQEAVDIYQLEDGGKAAVAQKAADAMRHWAAVVRYNLNPNTPAAMDREIEEIERLQLENRAAGNPGLLTSNSVSNIDYQICYSGSEGEGMNAEEKSKKLNVVQKDNISSWPKEIREQVRRSLSGMEPNTFQTFGVQNNHNGEIAQLYIVARDQNRNMWSIALNREAGLDSGIVIA